MAEGRIEVRAANAEDMDAFGFVVGTGLAIHGEARRRIVGQMRPQWTTCVFEDGELSTAFATWPFSMRFNGARIAVAGVTTVATLPSKRRRGFLRRAMQQSFAEQRDRGQSLAILYASRGAIYQRFGYALASLKASYEISPREIRFASGPRPSGRVRLAARGDLGTLQPIYRAYAEPRNGLLHRGEALWDGGAFAAPDDPAQGPVLAAIYEEDGVPQGYAVYGNYDAPFGDVPGPTQRLVVRDLAWLTPSALVGLWEFFAGHDLVERVSVRKAPEDDPIVHLLEEPRRLRRRLDDGIYLRVVDVERALPQRPYGAAAALAFEVIDPQCDWNHATWDLETDGARTEVRRSARAPQLRIPVQALAAMVNGFLAPSALLAMGRIEAADHADLDLWDAVFRARSRPFCADDF